MRSIISNPALDYDELRFDYGDVVLAAIGWGEWQGLERSLAEGLACTADAEQRAEQVGPEELHRASVSFRRAHALLAGEDYLRWLADRSLSTSDPRAHLARAALRARLPGASRSAPRSPSRCAGASSSIRGEAVLGDHLRSWSERLARCAAAARGLAADGEQAAASGTPSGSSFDAAARCPSSGLSEAQTRERAPRIAALSGPSASFAIASSRANGSSAAWPSIGSTGSGSPGRRWPSPPREPPARRRCGFATRG